MDPKYAEDLWQSAAHLQPTAYTSEVITSDDLHDTLLAGTFMIPPLMDKDNSPPSARKYTSTALPDVLRIPIS